MTREDCRDCACLVCGKEGQWVCDECEKEITLIEKCPEESEKKTFSIIIEETVSQKFEIEADSIDEALELAREGYLDGEYVLEPGDLESAKAIHCESNKEIEIV